MSKIKDAMIDMGIGLPGMSQLLIGTKPSKHIGRDFFVYQKSIAGTDLILRCHESELTAGEHSIIQALHLGQSLPGSNSIFVSIDGVEIIFGFYHGYIVEKGSLPEDVRQRLDVITAPKETAY